MNNLVIDEKTSKFFNEIDDNFGRVKGYSKKIPIEYQPKFINIFNPEDMIRVRTLISEGDEKRVNTNTNHRSKITFYNNMKHLDFEVLLFKKVDENYVSSKLIRLEDPLGLKNKKEPNYKVPDSHWAKIRKEKL